MKTRVDIDTKTFIRFWLVVIGFALLALIIFSARSALILIGAAFFLALALNKPVSALANFLPGKSRVGGTTIAFILVVAVIGVFLILVVPPIISQSVKVAESAPELIDNAQSQWNGLDPLIQQYGLQGQVDRALESLKSNATGWAANAGAVFVSSVGSVFSIIASIFLILVLAFLMLIEAPSWLKRLWGMYNNQERLENHQHLADRMYNVVTGYVTGQLTVSGIGALFAGLTVFILSFIFEIPHDFAFPAAAIAFVFSLIPMFGSTIAGVLICILLAFSSLTAALIFAAYFIIYQQIENNFISPTIQSKTVELSALAVLVSVTIGLYLFGIAGGIISIPIAGSIKVLLEDYLERAKKNRKNSSNPIHKLIKKVEES
ncbi:MAG: AI-2E family transporter [Candidatus Saccharimonadales bacterium]